MPKLPELSAEEKRHTEQAFQFIANEIDRQGGAISFADYMHLALYAPTHGYYSGQSMNFGPVGDFVTAPEISSLFGQCLAEQATALFKDIPNGEILELGAGTGKLALDIMHAFLHAGQGLPRYTIFEPSENLRQRQQKLFARYPELAKHVTWLDTLDNFSMDGVVIANEVLDAMPVQRFKIGKDSFLESYVEIAKGKLHEIFKPTKNPHLLSYYTEKLQPLSLPPGYISEVNLAMQDTLKKIHRLLNNGAVFFIDYGYCTKEYFHTDRHEGTLKCHHKHFMHTELFTRPGIQDITAHVNFTDVAEQAHDMGFDILGYTTQGYFLLSLGIMDIVAKQEDHTNSVILSQKIKQLALPSEMGESFKVIALGKNCDTLPHGFQLQDLRYQL